MAWTPAPWDKLRWRTDAACRESDPTLFFPIGSGGAAMRQAAEAKAVCANCPVSEDCLVFAVTTNQEYGVWGGLDEQERQEVRREWRRARRQPTAAAR